MIDQLRLLELAQMNERPLKITSAAAGFICAICDAEQESHAWRVTLPARAGKACPGCANDAGFEVR